MNAKVTSKEKIAIIKMLNKHFTIGEGAENLINALVRECSEKEKQEEHANLVLFAFATIAKPLIDDVSVEPLRKEKTTLSDDKSFPPVEKIIIKSLTGKLNLVKVIKKVCCIPLQNATEKTRQIVDGYRADVNGYTFNQFFVGNTPESIFTIEEWKEICSDMLTVDKTFKWETL